MNEPPQKDLVTEARAKLAKPNYGMGKRNRELTKLCDEVEKWQRAAGHWKARHEKAEESNAALRDQLAQANASRRVHELDNHHNALACGYCAGPIKDEITRLQSRLAQVEKEREFWNRLKTATGKLSSSAAAELADILETLP